MTVKHSEDVPLESIPGATGASRQVMIGPDERASGNFVLRDLSTGEQRALAHDQIETELVDLVGPAAPLVGR